MRKMLEKIERTFGMENKRYRFTLLISDENYTQFPSDSHAEFALVDAEFVGVDPFSVGGNSDGSLDDTFLVHGVIDTDSIEETLKVLVESGWEV
jgi:hypothetical protein